MAKTNVTYVGKSQQVGHTDPVNMRNAAKKKAELKDKYKLSLSAIQVSHPVFRSAYPPVVKFLGTLRTACAELETDLDEAKFSAFFDKLNGEGFTTNWVAQIDSAIQGILSSGTLVNNAMKDTLQSNNGIPLEFWETESTATPSGKAPEVDESTLAIMDEMD